MLKACRAFVLLLLSCSHATVQETRTEAIEAGLPVTFSESSALTWDFGDASPRVTGREVQHAFGHPGRFLVQAFEPGSTALVRRITTIVEPRAALHSVPPEATWAVLARNADDFAPAIDFAERTVGAQAIASWLEHTPLLAFALEQGLGHSTMVEAREGLGLFGLSASDVTVSFVGVSDGPQAMQALAAWLTERGFEGGPSIFSAQGSQLEVFVDRGILYAAFGEQGSAPVVERVARASPLGLKADPAASEALENVQAGGWVVFARADDARAQWSLFAGAVALAEDEARFGAKVISSGPLWAVPPTPPGRLLEHAPEGPVAALSLSLPPKTLASLVFGNKGTARRERLAQRFGSDVEQVFESLGGVVDAAGYFDAESFFRSTVENEGRPSPRGTVLAEASVTNSLFFGEFLEAMLLQNAFRSTRAQDKGVSVWRFMALGEPVELAVTPSTFFVKAGEPVKGRAGTDLVARWRRDFEGAFAPGHVSLMLDVGQLRREIMAPRLISGVDPRRVLTAQAIAQTLLDRLTQIEVVVLDVAPSSTGASLEAAIRLRKPAAR